MIKVTLHIREERKEGSINEAGTITPNYLGK